MDLDDIITLSLNSPFLGKGFLFLAPVRGTFPARTYPYAVLNLTQPNLTQDKHDNVKISGVKE